MSDSLQDQLRSLGLVKKKPSSKKPRKAGKNRKSARGDGHAGKAAGEISLDAAYRARHRDDKESAARAKAEKRARDLERQRLNREIEAMVKDQALNDREGDLKRNFLYKGKIRSVRVNAKQLEQLNAGQLGLVFLRGDYLLVPPELAAQVKDKSPDHVPELGQDTAEEEEHPVPDDLIW